MGSVSTHHATELSLALQELGVPEHYTVVRKAAGGHDPDGTKLTWFHIRANADGHEILALAYTSRAKSYGVMCKLVTESMGPGALDVPDAIWANLPPLPEGTYAANWRIEVADFKDQWPLRLTDVAVGAECEVHGYPGTFRRIGGHAGLSAPMFTNNTTYRTVVFARWRERRARLVTKGSRR